MDEIQQEVRAHDRYTLYLNGLSLDDTTSKNKIKGKQLTDKPCASVRIKLCSHHAEDTNDLTAKHKTTTTPKAKHITTTTTTRVPTSWIWTGSTMKRIYYNKKSSLAERLGSRVVGQDEAIDAVGEAVQRSRARVTRPHQPTCSFLFVGPNGVGKAELAKALAEQLFGHEKRMIMYKMSSYKEDSISYLTGDGPAGLGFGWQLTDSIRHNPKSVVLFDEVEKAHESVFKILLQILDEGRLTDAEGTIDFSDTIIIMASKVGVEHLIDGVHGKCSIQEVKKTFTPELLNRFDEIAVFDPLSHDQLREVVRLQIEELEGRVIGMDFLITVSDAALDFIISKSCDAVHGARPMNRWIRNTVGTQMAIMFLHKELREDSTLCIDVAPGEDSLTYQDIK